MNISDCLSFKKHIRNVSIEDEDLIDIVDTIIKDIARETRIFRKIYSFTTFPEIEIYDLNFIANINERSKKNVVDITIHEPTEEEILSLIKKGTSFSDYVQMSNTDRDPTGLVSLMDTQIFDENIKVTNDFQEIEGFNFKYKYKLNDVKQYLFEATIIPSFDTITETQFDILKPSIIEGVKYYVLDDITDARDSQTANTYYMRYFNEKRKIFNMYPERKSIEINRSNGFTIL